MWATKGYVGKGERGRALSGPEEPVSGVAEARQDVALVVQLPVEGRGEHRDVGVGGEHRLYAGGRGHKTEEPDPRSAGLFQGRHRGHRRAARGEHGVEDEKVARLLARG